MIPFHQESRVGDGEPGFFRSLLAAMPRTYALVFYSADARFGWALLGLSLLVPWAGLAGLAGVLATVALGWWVGVDRGWIRSGFALFNPLLSCSAVVLTGIGLGWEPGVIAVLWAAAVVLALALTVGMQGWMGSWLGLSVQSLPAVIAVVLLQWCGMATVGQGGKAAGVVWHQVDLVMLPDFLRAFFQAFAAMVFQSSAWVGAVIYVALVLSSPLGALMATVGYVAGAATLYCLGWPVTPLGTGWCGFNFILAGVALGAGYQVPNRSSLGLAAVGAALTAVAAVALSLAMGWFKLGPGALPYNLVVLCLMIGLRWLPQPRGIVRSPWTTLQPEASARLMQLNALRFPDFHRPALLLPWIGTRVVTQGFSGKLTHRGAWRHALDFEAPGGAGSWDPGTGDLREFSVFETVVHSPVGGTVVALENNICDNPVGHNNPERNWGNYVIIRADAGFHVMLAHFLQGSVVVVSGQRVEAGFLLGKCGNSGRSPVPHLHVHVQAGALPGAATLPFVLKHFIEVDAASGRERYRLSGVPGCGAVLRSVQPSAGLYACFSGWLPGRQVFAGSEREEVLAMDFDDAGRFRIDSLTRGETLTLFLAEGVLYASPFNGRSGGVLALLGILLARVPCLDEPGVHWNEVVAAAPFQGLAKRVQHDLLDPFIGVETLQYEFQMLALEDQGFEIVARLAPGNGKLAAAAPRILRGLLMGRNGVVDISGETCAGETFHIFRQKEK